MYVLHMMILVVFFHSFRYNEAHKNSLLNNCIAILKSYKGGKVVIIDFRYYIKVCICRVENKKLIEN